MKSLLTFILSPVGVLLILVAIQAYRFRIERRSNLKFPIFIFLYFLLISTPWLPRHLSRSLESRYDRLPYQDVDSLNAPYIMVLGAGFDVDPDLRYTQQLNHTTLSRLLEGVQLYKEMEGARLITSAGTTRQPVSQARVAALAALELGVSPKDTLMLEHGLTTEGEAIDFVNRFGKEKVILVTSAMHMPRAMMIFEAYGAKPIPAPTDFRVSEGPKASWIYYLPSAASIEQLDRCWHEYLGMVWFQLKHRFS